MQLNSWFPTAASYFWAFHFPLKMQVPSWRHASGRYYKFVDHQTGAQHQKMQRGGGVNGNGDALCAGMS